MVDVPEGWEARGKPLALFRRFEFERYGATRDFLDGLAALTEQTGIHPQNINFGTTYVNVTLEGADGNDPGEQECMLAQRISALSQPAGK
jgi:4a-hydroxytetrahydrobiopterin dehydratase